MKKLFVPVILMLLSSPLFTQKVEVIRFSEPVQETETFEVFGSEVEQWNEANSLILVIDSEQELAGKEVTVETEIAKVCQKKGCLFVATQDGYSARITFKDYGFFIATDSQGKTVTLVGAFTVKELSEEQARHYAEDAGEDAEAIEVLKKNILL